MSCGPITFAKGDTQEVVFAEFVSQGTDNIQSIVQLRSDAQSIRTVYDNTITGVEQTAGKTDFHLYQNYPNPFGSSSFSASQTTHIPFFPIRQAGSTPQY